MSKAPRTSSSEWPWVKVDDVEAGSPVARNQASSIADLQRGWSESVQTPTNNDDSFPVYSIPTSTQGPEYFAGAPQDGTKTLLIVMVGLPARGKTFLAQKLCRLLGWHGIRSQTFNVQVVWKQKLKELHHLDPDAPLVTSAETFQQICTPGTQTRKQYNAVLKMFAQQAKEFYESGGVVVVLNDDFTTKELRDEVEEYFTPLASSTVYVEVQRDSSANETFDSLKISDPEEYPLSAGSLHLSAVDSNPATPTLQDPKIDFQKRVKILEKTYDTMTPSSGKSYIKIKNEVLEVHRVQGFLCGRIVSFLMNLSQFKVQHPIYFVRHGQSMYNLEDRLGGDPVLTKKGEKDAIALLEFIKTLKTEDDLLTAGDPDSCIQIWTSQLKRAIQTAQPAEDLLGVRCLRWSSLNEIHAGVCENLTYKEVEREYPLIHRFRGENKYTFRYPQGESYQDLVMRLEPVIMELENANRVVLVVAHQAVLRALLAYFGSTSAESSVYVEVPHRTVWRCTYNSKGIATVDKLKLGDPATGDGCKD